MRKIYINLAFGLLSLIGHHSLAQSGITKADKNYEALAYIDAIKVYENIALRGKADASTLEKLGNSYYFNAQYKDASKWYGVLFEKFSDQVLDAEYYYRYAQTLKNIGQTAEAEKYLTQFANKVPSSKRSELIQKETDYRAEIRKNSGRYAAIQNLATNTVYSDYGSSVYNNELLFATARDTGNFSKRVHTWTGHAFTSLYRADITEDGNTTNASRFSKELHSPVNESSAVVSADGNTIYFTRNNYNSKRGFNEEKTTLLKIYQAQWKNGRWTDITEVPFNSDQYNTAHPALSADGETMYFVSDRPGGMGKADIWRVSLQAGRFGIPENLGPEINTEGRETFPFVTSQNELYFSSDARPGLGGLDVFGAKIKSDGSVGAVQNLGEPINSPSDDFAYIINTSTKKGFFSSNRDGGIGDDDIYSFLETRSLLFDCLQSIKAKVVDAQTGNVIKGAQMILTNTDQEVIRKQIQSTAGFQNLVESLECRQSYRLRATAEKYQDNEVYIQLDEEPGSVEQVIVLTPKKIEVKKGDDLFKVLDLSIIYFDFDKWNIRKDAAIELEKIRAVLEEYPKMKIDVRSHTDSRGNDAYNLRLSQRRAKSTAEWLINQGIDASRVTYKGYGETDLMNDCRNGIPCTEAQHQENRRSEFLVTDL